MVKQVYSDCSLSIIVPVYNVEKTIERAVKSIINQSYKNLEIILVNDGSTDKSGQIIEKLAEDYNIISAYHKENGGLSSARNYGIARASGEIIGLLDSDDYYMPDFFENVIPYFNQEELDIVAFGFVKGNDKLKKYYLPEQKTLSNTQAIIKELFINQSVDFYAWNKFYRRKLFKNIEYPEGRLYEDVIPTYELMKKTRKVQYLSIAGLFYYQNPESIIYQQFNPRQYDNIDQRIVLLKKIRQEFPELTNLAQKKLIDGYLSTGFKLTTKTKDSRDQKKYLKKLRNEIKQQYFKLMTTSSPLTKKLALNLLYINAPLYNKLYKLILKK
ncbi:glycosyltransferase family 2 protein [Melissococcus plutonius]|uniref:Putative glycosyltransferase protein n=1 Tax=Melissococcus plutonius TaxID=33970 RepID=A0A2Z5Y383_9ENTE|nr:glycosyltransferase family 2 protein [Melissococcus plutonius]BAL62342.1 beta-1,3-glucosyltransferase [Melissococcus plutonius DAT561]MCV2498110.1 glycosyltransferase [Melissococcus plutonius]MCV2500697.1 glycosyltransferase [Melissococcus plutonius]MCV2504338.1 glycosyltransferase [Melissococcus plutonius]MCV2506725.1 glycosyltransferase [Melissococcus plutonius]